MSNAEFVYGPLTFEEYQLMYASLEQRNLIYVDTNTRNEDGVVTYYILVAQPASVNTA